MRHTLFLFDVDGVLIDPQGYKQALADALDAWAQRMGAPSPALTHAEIAFFEANGVTNEWDSLAICLSLMIISGTQKQPGLIGATLAETLADLRYAKPSFTRPDFSGFISQVAEARQGQVTSPARVALDLLLEQVNPSLRPVLSEVLGDVYNPHAPATLLFQNFTLGSDQFERIYGQAAPIPGQVSTLLTADRPHLNEEDRALLLEHLQTPHFSASIYTARPSGPPRGLPQADVDSQLYFPEGDLAAELLRLTDLPLIGAGRMAWAARQFDRYVADYLKPAPVQALAAAAAALCRCEVPALTAAAAFYEQGVFQGALDALRKAPIRVVVFEDSPTGVHAVRGAVERLRGAGCDVTFEAVGVAQAASKREALAPITDAVVDDIHAGLHRCLRNADG